MGVSVNSILQKMREQGVVYDIKSKGDLGESAALQIVLQRLVRTGGFVYHSFQYPYQSGRDGVTKLGNIKYENGKYVDYTSESLKDEIDILYVTPCRIFPIEVKSYHAKLKVFDYWMYKSGDIVEKSPIAQAEKHARHLYYAINDVIPDGNPSYIKPIVCFVDRCSLEDARSNDSIDYLPCCILNNLKKTLVKYGTQLDYNLDLENIERKLTEVKLDGTQYK